MEYKIYDLLKLGTLSAKAPGGEDFITQAAILPAAAAVTPRQAAATLLEVFMTRLRLLA